MPQLKLLILDACVVIKLVEIGLWERVVEKCEVFLSRIVVEHEVRYFKGKDCDETIDLSDYVDSERISVIEIDKAELAAFLDRFDPVYLEQLDPGEAESLAYLMFSRKEYVFCSADKIVYRVLGRLQRGHQGISLEEILQQIGLQRSLPKQYSKAFREHWTKQGEKEMVYGTGLKRRDRN